MPAVRKRIARPIKNAMRTRLERLLQHYQEIGGCISQFRNETDHEDYIQFLEGLQRDNEEMIRHISKYMVMRCNR